MTPLHKHHDICTLPTQFPTRSPIYKPGVVSPSDYDQKSGLSRSVKPSNTDITRGAYLHSSSGDCFQNPHDQRLPGIHEILFPRTEARSSTSATRLPVDGQPAYHIRLPNLQEGFAYGRSISRVSPTAREVSKSSLSQFQMRPPVRDSYRQGNMPIATTTTSQFSSLLPIPLLYLEQDPNPAAYHRQKLPPLSGRYPRVKSLYDQNMDNMLYDSARKERIPQQQPKSGSTYKTITSGRTNKAVDRRYITGNESWYFFNDGSKCPTVIDGEPVNPLWGITKAGKARKRLPQACLYGSLCLNEFVSKTLT